MLPPAKVGDVIPWTYSDALNTKACPWCDGGATSGVFDCGMKIEWHTMGKSVIVKNVCSKQTEKPADKPCTCDIMLLMSAGCQCGGV